MHGAGLVAQVQEVPPVVLLELGEVSPWVGQAEFIRLMQFLF